MANQDVRVSALQSASTLSTDDLALATVVDELSETGYTSKKITEGDKAAQYLEAFTFANLNTTAKTIVGAINEAATTGGSDEFIIHMTDTTITETAADIIDAFDNGSEIWLESQITGETIKTRLPLLAYISDSSQLVLRFSGITYANNRYRYCDVQMLRSPEQIVGRQSINVSFAVIDDATTSASSVWSSQKTASELAGKAEIDDTAVSSSTAWSSEQIVSLLPTESASGAVANFETPLTLPLVSHSVTIEPVQAGTGDPSPSNVRPISGFTGMTIHCADGENPHVIDTEYEVDWTTEAGTVYGGELDVTSGVLTVTKVLFTVNSSNKVEFMTSNIFRINKSKYPDGLFTSDNINGLMCSKFKPQISSTATDTCYNTANGLIIRPITGYSSAKAFYEGVGEFSFTYLLATPVEVTLTPEQINTLEGVNNIWADTGDTAVEYKQDIQTYIDSRLSSGTRSLTLAKAPVETKEETKQEEQEGDEDVNR